MSKGNRVWIVQVDGEVMTLGKGRGSELLTWEEAFSVRRALSSLRRRVLIKKLREKKDGGRLKA